ncbi:MAG TPA: MMPL family transporter, partial [Verrucomicrobiae bacterium]|nr:MMPL family transporter [Verrucomicrobiae bacterium]
MRSRHWLWLILAVPVALGLLRLRFDVEVLNLLPDDLPVVRGLKLYQQNFSNARELIITLRGADAEKTEAAARSLAEALRAQTNLISSVVWEPAWMERPAQAAELIAYLWLNQPPDIFSNLADRLSGTNLSATLADAREQLATSLSPMDLARRGYDPYDLMRLPENITGMAASFGGGQNLFSSPDGTFRIMFVQSRRDIGNYRADRAWLDSIKQTIQNARKRAGVSNDVAIAFTGGPAFVAEIAGGMEHDITTSVGLTSVIIALLFWFFHRKLVPMLWLLILLALILGSTLALGGLLFGVINVVSLGFAGILLGLAVDYGVVHYQEAMASPNAIIPEIRRAIGPSIFWAAVTTISAFLVLNFSGLPGLAQLGSLVALGVTLSALVMLFAFLPPLFRDRMKRRLERFRSGHGPAAPTATAQNTNARSVSPGIAFGLTALLALAAGIVLSFGPPKLDHTANALRLQNSPAYAALDEIKNYLTQNREPLWLITTGQNEAEVARHLEQAASVLGRAATNRLIDNFTLPIALWPRPDYQAANRAAIAGILAERNTLRSAALAEGFSANSLVMTDHILDSWQGALATDQVFWPTNETSRWILEKMAARPRGEFLAVGFVYPNTNSPVTPASVSPWADELSREGFVVSGWELLGPSILKRVQQNLWKVATPMVALVLLSLFLAFRRPAEILLSLAVLALSGLCLLAVMRLAGWSWNLLNLMALPLMLGSGVDYSIFLQLALRRHHGDMAAAHRSVGRALLLCGGTAVAGFGSLSLSTNAGMSSLGQVCAVGIGCNMLFSVYLLPFWWRAALAGDFRRSTAGSHPAVLSKPSSLYKSGFWRLGLKIVFRLSPSASARLSQALAGVYWAFAGLRREVVIENLLPAFNGDYAAAKTKSNELIRQFALKLVDLWRYENGLSIDHLFGEWTGWEHFAAALEQKRGILLVTPHLGNWEFGAPLLTRRGVNLQVITLAEPGSKLTQMRRESRARWDIETLVIGEDPFAFVEIIRRLEAGATVALLIDRPPSASAVTVELFGRPFPASIAAAELARASGCVVLPVYLPRAERGYAAHILPPIPYDRAGLRDREARRQFTQKIVNAFEPAIRRYLDQWYHFVPVWEQNPPAD